ncbi:MAG: DUF1549 domain-containing protein [Deltaproteobacteria bacterium]|nr:MAG: DUF1549 domain-containing protein [Deltaproteobacteria bacterium]
MAGSPSGPWYATIGAVGRRRANDEPADRSSRGRGRRFGGRGWRAIARGLVVVVAVGGLGACGPARELGARPPARPRPASEATSDQDRDEPSAEEQRADAPIRAHTPWDRALLGVWKAANVIPAPRADAATWLRRASLVVAGRVPTPKELRAFVARDGDDARDAAVARLLADPGFARRWGRVYAGWFVRPTHLRRPAFRQNVEPYYQGATARPYDEVARELLTARGAVSEVPAATFLASQRPGRTQEELAAITLDLFVAKDAYYCAQCHDHPEDPEIRQEDLWGVAAYFARTRVPRRQVPGRPNVLEVRDWHTGELRRPEAPKEARRVIPPRYLDGRTWLASADGSRREALAEAILADPDFARAFVVRVWSEVFGDRPDPRLEPVVASLAAYVRDGGYDLRSLVRALVLSEAFARAAGGARDGDVPAEHLLARFPLRPLPADVRLDVLLQVTSAEPTVPHFVPLAERARRVEGARRRYRHVFDGAGGDGVAGTIPMRLSELHDPIAFRATRFRPGSRLHVIAAAHPDPERRLEALYLWAFSRPPSPEEKRRLLPTLAEADHPRRAWEDLFHAMVLSAEFSTLH